MQKLLLFLYDQMADFEVALAAYGIATEGAAQIVPIGYNETAVSAAGIEYRIHATVQEALDMDGVCGLLIPGGFTCDLREELIALIRRLDEKEKLLAAICAGPQYLARSGVLENRAYTTSIRRWTEEDARRFGGSDPFPRETFRAQRVVRDGHIITAYGDAFVDFAVEIFDYFGLFRDAEERDSYLREVRGK